MTRKSPNKWLYAVPVFVAVMACGGPISTGKVSIVSQTPRPEAIPTDDEATKVVHELMADTSIYDATQDVSHEYHEPVLYTVKSSDWTSRDPSPVPVPQLEDSQRFWCFTMPDWGDCQWTKQECNDRRLTFINTECQHSDKMLNTICQESRAPAMQISECSRQPVVACFKRYDLLYASDGFACAPSIRQCKERRKYELKNLSDDFKIKSGCAPMD